MKSARAGEMHPVFIMGRTYLQSYRRKYFISEDSFLTLMHSFAIARNFCCHSYLEENIHRLFAAGVFQKIVDDEQFILELKKTLSGSNEHDNPKSLQLQDVKGAFMILFFGYILSTIGFFTEIIVKYKYSSTSASNNMCNFLNK